MKLNSPALQQLFRQQQLYVFIAVAVAGFFWATNQNVNLVAVLAYSLCLGNLGTLGLQKISPVYCNRSFPWNWLIYLPLLILWTIPIYVVATVVVYYVTPRIDTSLWHLMRYGWKFPVFVCLLWGMLAYLYESMRDRLEARNRVLEQKAEISAARVETQEQELQRALEIQRSLLPKEIPQVPGFEVAGTWQPARVVGGDYFDVLKLPGDRLAVCIADVVGKSVSAALLMANLQATVRAFAQGSHSPAWLCGRVNNVLCNNMASDKFVTFFYGIIDPAARTLEYCNAGHLHPMVIEKSGEVRRPDGGSIVLGLFPEAKFEDSKIAMQPGERLLLFTDGITEAFAPSGEEFGEERIASTARAHREDSALAMADHILKEVRSFCGEQFADDATLLTIAVADAV